MLRIASATLIICAPMRIWLGLEGAAPVSAMPASAPPLMPRGAAVALVLPLVLLEFTAPRAAALLPVSAPLAVDRALAEIEKVVEEETS